MHNYDELHQTDQELPAFELYAKKGIEIIQLPKQIGEEHIVAREKLPSGTEIIIEIPPVLHRYAYKHNSQNQITKFCQDSKLRLQPTKTIAQVIDINSSNQKPRI